MLLMKEYYFLLLTGFIKRTSTKDITQHTAVRIKEEVKLPSAVNWVDIVGNSKADEPNATITQP